MRTIYRVIVGAFIFSSDNKLLLGKTGTYEDYWVVPGGGIDDGETKLGALHREVIEETGIDIHDPGIKVEKIKGTLTGESEKTLRETKERVFVKMKFYNYKVLLSLPANEVSISAEDDFKDAMWTTIDELHTLTLAPPSVATLKKLGYLKSVKL